MSWGHLPCHNSDKSEEAQGPTNGLAIFKPHLSVGGGRGRGGCWSHPVGHDVLASRVVASPPGPRSSLDRAEADHHNSAPASHRGTLHHHDVTTHHHGHDHTDDTDHHGDDLAADHHCHNHVADDHGPGHNDSDQSADHNGELAGDYGYSSLRQHGCPSVRHFGNRHRRFTSGSEGRFHTGPGASCGSLPERSGGITRAPPRLRAEHARAPGCPCRNCSLPGEQYGP